MNIAIASDHAGFRYKAVMATIRIVDIWMTTAFEGGRHVKRIQKLDAS